MGNNYLLLLGFVFVFSNSFSQNNVENQNFLYQVNKILDANEIEPFSSNAKRKFKNKALADTLHYQPFTDSLPAGYQVINNMSNSNVWKWDTVNQARSYFGFPRIKSTTGATGFMSLPISFYNFSSYVLMNTFFVSDKITISPQSSVLLQYQMYLATCCNASDEVVIEISLDSANWDSYDLTQGVKINTANADTTTAVTFETINLSYTLANQSEFWYRVRVNGPILHFIMLDDFAFIEGPCNDLVLSDSYSEFNETNYNTNPFYGQIPCMLFSPLPFSATISSMGGCDQTGVELNVSVTHLNTPGGGPATGYGLAYSTSITVGFLPSLVDTSVLTGLPRFIPSVLGSYEVEFSVVGDSIDQFPGNESHISTFTVTDSILARDDNNFEGVIGPRSYADRITSTPGGTIKGDRFGSLYIVENITGNGTANIPTSITFAVSANKKNIGVEIVPKIWEFNEDSSTVNAAFGAEVASSFIPYTITSSDTNTLLTLVLNKGAALTTGTGLDSGQYVVGWEVTSLPTAQPSPAPKPSFEVYNDESTAAIQPSVSTFLYLAHAPTTGWLSVAENPVIRLNMGNLGYLQSGGCFTTSVFESKVESSTQFELAPNPSNGQIKLNISTEHNISYSLNVRNMLGQVVYTSTLKVNGATTERLDLSGLEKGVYFVSLENEKLLKKVVLK